jgi:hypothetical protein
VPVEGHRAQNAQFLAEKLGDVLELDQGAALVAYHAQRIGVRVRGRVGGEEPGEEAVQHVPAWSYAARTRVDEVGVGLREIGHLFSGAVLAFGGAETREDFGDSLVACQVSVTPAG